MKKIAICLLCGLLWGIFGTDLKATQGDPELRKILLMLKTYEQGRNDDLILKLNAHIRSKRQDQASRQACENEMLLFLADDISPAATLEACRHLRIIGSDRSVPLLTKMLLQKVTTDVARYALEIIPGPAAQHALQLALAQSQGDMKIGLINTLGKRGDPGAVLLLGRLLNDPDQGAAQAAVRALGQIPDPRAVELLSRTLTNSSNPLRMESGFALLYCAERYLRQKNLSSASSIYGKLLDSATTVPLRRAALRGMIAASPETGGQLILETLQAEDQVLYGPAIDMIGPGLKPTTIEKVCLTLPHLPEQNQAQLLLSLTGFERPEVFSAATTALSSGSGSVRLAALKALSRIGGTAGIDLLLDFASGAKGHEQTAARFALWDLGGSDVDTEILARLSRESRPEIQNELIQCIGERRIKQGKDLLFQTTLSEHSVNRISAVRALKNIAGPEDIPRMLSTLEQLEMDFEQMEMVVAAALVAGRIYNKEDRADAVVWQLGETENDQFRCLLLRILGKIGDDSSLYLIRNALLEKNQVIVDAAVRALADWPQTTARDDIIDIARTSENPVHRVLALQAYVRLIGSEEFRKPEGVVASLKEAMNLTSRPEEKILILGILPRFSCPDGLQLAESLLVDNTVKAEAELAAEQIRRRLEIR